MSAFSGSLHKFTPYCPTEVRMTLDQLPPELLILLPFHLDTIKDVLSLSSCSRALYLSCSHPDDRVIPRLAAGSGESLFRPHPNLLTAAMARKLANWAVDGDSENRRYRLEVAIQNGVEGLLSLMVDVVTLSMVEVRALKVYEREVLSRVSLHPSGEGTNGNDLERLALLSWITYGELFHHSIEVGQHTVKPLSTVTRLKWIVFCMPDVYCYWNLAFSDFSRRLKAAAKDKYKTSQQQRAMLDLIDAYPGLNPKRWRALLEEEEESYRATQLAVVSCGFKGLEYLVSSASLLVTLKIILLTEDLRQSSGDRWVYAPTPALADDLYMTLWGERTSNTQSWTEEMVERKDALMEEIRKNNVTVLLGETGSGKTTQVPQYLLECGLAGSGIIGVTQPRKVAATSLAARVSEEQGTVLGRLVGYSVRFDEQCGPETRVKYMTDGMLTRELLGDPLLTKYSVLIIDEAHERTLRTDLLLANLKRILRERNGDSQGKGKGRPNPLKVVIMSATLDAEKFSKFFSDAKIIYVKGRQHPVKVYHAAQSQTDYVEAASRTFFQIHVDQGPGDVLIFLPGQEDIESLQLSIEDFARKLPPDHAQVLVVPMFAALQQTQMQRIFTPTPRKVRKCILATNIAETSITIPGVRYVIDTGKSKEKRYLAGSNGGGFDTLLTRDITKSNAMQRAGRAGREGPGVCYRLFTEDAFSVMHDSPEPEILRCSLSQAMLHLFCLGQDLQELDLMDAPNAEALSAALRTLFLLGALDSHRAVTPLGRVMASFPLEPAFARALVASAELSCTTEVLDIVSVLSASSKIWLDVTDKRADILEARRKVTHPTGDHMTILNTVRTYRAVGGETEDKVARTARKEWARQHYVNERTIREATAIREQLRECCSRAGIDWRSSCGDLDEPVLMSLAHGLAPNSALIGPDGSYKQIMGHSVVKIHPSSSVADKKFPAIIFDELVYTNQVYARGVSSISKTFFAKHGVLSQRAV
ncbi:unnamed protein product [Mycena citricolor]|uniref:RNA helicase n=1 Tax=Mycena citricolor TaxID=2018698 RepID=A0AAD2JZ56_9AGAR|nr:unnamed protein product [Mycena citricolor]